MTPNDNDEEKEPKIKSRKLDEIDLKSFKIDEILNSNNRGKTIILLGQFPTQSPSEKSIIILEKSNFPEDVNKIATALSSDNPRSIESIMTNDVYRSSVISGLASLDSIKTTLIRPASAEHIAKFRASRFRFVRESAAIYRSISLPLIESHALSPKWIDNLMENRSEQDAIVIGRDEIADKSFVAALDYKWDRKSMENIHCLAIACDGAVRSVRDLTRRHLPMLGEMRARTGRALSQRYGLDERQLRFFVHYPPSFWRLHVHVTHASDDGRAALIDRAISLSTVMDNIELESSYYERATLEIAVTETDPIYGALWATEEERGGRGDSVTNE